MARKSEQKISILILYDILQKETNENVHLSTEQLIEKLAERGISVERRAVIRDIETLNNSGFEVMSYKKKSYYYYIADRRFDIAELRILIDAVQSASFISEVRTADFIDKLAALAGDRKAELLTRNIVCYDTVKHDNKHIFYSIDALETAIEDGKKVSFLYFDYDTHKEKVYRKNKSRYTVNPLALIFTNDNYYLVCYSDKYLNLSNYRIDRMENLKIEGEDITYVAEYERFNIHKHKKEAFSMFVGEVKTVELEVENDMIDEIIDKFGKDVRITYRTDTYFRIFVDVQISPPFFAWTVMLRGKVRIRTPHDVKEQMNQFTNQSYIC